MQPDTIVPGAGNPQNFNRYSYVGNSPIMFNDKTGHVPGSACIDGVYCSNKLTAESVAANYGVKFENGSKTWTKADKLAALKAIVDIARRLSARTGNTAINAFKSVFNTSSVPIALLMGNKGSQFNNDGSGKGKYCEIDSGGCTVGVTRYKDTGQLVNVIKFELFSSVFFRATNNVVHELGHVFNNIYKPTLGSSFSRDALIPNPVYAQEVLEWQQHPHADGSELFADTFIAWTYDAWNPLNVDAATLAQNAMNSIPLP